jgi:iron-sulfur cluster repair protein YtfE (RIC family)
MLHTIGRKQTVSGDLVDMLLECHGRIRTFSALAIAAGERGDVPADELVEACTRVERYFGLALPLHVRDEEESVLPRLRGRSPAVDAALDRMHDEHAHHAPMLEALLTSSAAVRATPGDVTARSALLAAANALHAAFEPHLESEEQILFPAMRALVPLVEQAAIVSELRARRGPTSI